MGTQFVHGFDAQPVQHLIVGFGLHVSRLNVIVKF